VKRRVVLTEPTESSAKAEKEWGS